MRDKFIRFMQGRYGVDDLSKTGIKLAFVLILVSVFIRKGTVLGALLDTAGLAIIIYTYYRIFSKDIQKRYQENQRFLEKTKKIRLRINKEKGYMMQRRTHHIYTCPGCGQKIRVPRGKGKIEISCPKCSMKFVKRS